MATIAGVSPVPQTFTVGSRSLFVTLTAWVFIVPGALAVVAALLLRASDASDAAAAGVLDAVLTLSLVLLASAVGLWLRLEGARRTFLILLAGVLLAQWAGLWLQQEALQALAQQAVGRVPPPLAAWVAGFVSVRPLSAVLPGLLATVAFVVVLRRLNSPAVRQEFA